MPSPLLRPLGVGEILDNGFAIYRRHFTVLFATALIATLPLAVATGAWLTVVDRLVQDDGAGAAAVAAGGLLFALAGLVVWSVVVAAIVRQVAAVVVGGEVSIADGCRRALRRFVPIATAFVLSSAAIAAGAAVVVMPLAVVLLIGLFIVMGAGGSPQSPEGMVLIGTWAVGTTLAVLAVMVLLMAGFFAVPQAVVVEHRGPVGALQRSWRLARGGRLRIIGVLVVSWIITMLPAIAVSYFTGDASGVFTGRPAPVTPGQLVIQQALSLLTSALTLPFFVACSTLLYFDRRVRAEAYDLEAAADALPTGS